MTAVATNTTDFELDQFESGVPAPLVQAGAARVRKLCIRLDQTPAELAAYLGLPTWLVTDLARGRRPVSVALLAELDRRVAGEGGISDGMITLS